MASREQIQMDFDQAKRRAEELEDIADRLEHLINNKFQTQLEETDAGWDGDSARFYLQKGNQLKEDMKKTEKDLRKAARTIRTIAQNVYNAEMKALEIAETMERAGDVIQSTAGNILDYIF